MLTLMLSMNVCMALMFTLLTHPLSMGVILLFQTIIIALITGNFNQNMWFSYILFLIMIGGMLVLFMYMTSIASNEKFKPSAKVFMVFILMIPISWAAPPLVKNKISNNEILEFNEKLMFNTSLNKYINLPLNLILIFMIIYLLLLLIITVKITNFKKGPIRQMN